MDFFKKASELADDMLNTVSWVVNRLNTTTKLYKPEEAKGVMAEVTVSVKANGTGEVVVVLGQSVRNFPARSAKSGLDFERGDKVRISDAGPNVVYIESCEVDRTPASDNSTASTGERTSAIPSQPADRNPAPAAKIEVSEKQKSKRDRRKGKSKSRGNDSV